MIISMFTGWSIIMPINVKRSISFGLTAVLAAGLIFSLAACSSPSSPAPSPATSFTTSPTASTPAQPSTRDNFASRRGGGASGTITGIDGNTLTLDTGQGTATVIVSANTSIQKNAAGSLAGLQTGQFLTVTGTADASGNTAASLIVVRPQDTNSRFSMPNGNMPGPGGRPGMPGGSGARPDFGGSGNGTFSGPGSGAFGAAGNGAFGTLSSIAGNTLTLTAVQGQEVTVTVGPDTVIQMIESGTLADLQVGDTLTVMGNQDASGNIDAFLITIGPGPVFPGGS
jgi:hypothetical protein